METFCGQLSFILLLALLSFAFLKLAQLKGFFHLPSEKGVERAQLSFKSLVSAFGIYLSISLLAPLFFHVVQERMPDFAYRAAFFLQLAVFFAILLLIFLYTRANQTAIFKRIWKDRKLTPTSSYSTDFLLGIVTWIIAFPLVLFVGELVDTLLYYTLGFETFEQVAVRYLKNALQAPEQLAVALATILFLAPLLEEFLFRGCLQTYFKRFFSRRNAILLSSFSFAIFHYATSQGLGNISLVISLFTFALFLGFIYERQGSLLASIALHMTFNAVSTFRVLFFPGD